MSKCAFPQVAAGVVSAASGGDRQRSEPLAVNRGAKKTNHYQNTTLSLTAERTLAPLRELHGSLALPGCRETPPLTLRGSLPSTNRHATDRGDRLTNSSPNLDHHPRASRGSARRGTA